jgi:predicted metalloprotease with PDZ domain
VVKRLKPAAFSPYDLFAENYTRLLWLFEGWTSYYDDLLLVRSGVIDADRYLGLLAKTATQVLTTPGRLRQSLEQASFDAWIKFYRPDENSANANVSYYAKGALLALALDLQLRERGASLDALLRALWERYGRSGKGIEEEAPFAVLHETAGARLARWLERMVRSTEDPPLAALLRRFGVHWRDVMATLPDAGLRFERDSMRVATVRRGGAAEQAGIAPRDEVVAIDGLKASPTQWEGVLRRRGAGARLAVHAFREGRLYQTSLELSPPALERVELGRLPRTTAQQRERLTSWLHPAAR